MMAAADTFQCCFCAQPTDVAGDGLLVILQRRGQLPTQDLGAHVGCLAERLHPSVVFDPEVFEE
jgi:hypothetical protein